MICRLFTIKWFLKFRAWRPACHSFCAACRLALQKTPQGQPFPAPAELINCPRRPNASRDSLCSLALLASGQWQPWHSLSPASARIFPPRRKTGTSSCWYRPKHNLSLAIINYLCRGCLIEKAEPEKDKQVEQTQRNLPN